MPERTERLEVRLHYLRLEGENVLDLGVADPHFKPEAYPNTQGFRGWSGGFRDRFVIMPEAATPGYLPGPLSTGTWHVILGLHKVAAEGCDYTLELRFGESSDTLALPLPLFEATLEPSIFTPGWHSGDLHAHTFHSDAAGSLDDLVMAARRRGLTFLAVTDHNTVSHVPHVWARSDLLLIPGQEVTTNFGHMNVWGASDWVDFRFQTEKDAARLVARAHALGGVTSVNHPKAGGPDWHFGVPEVHALEAWNGPWANRNWEALARYQALLCAGQRVTLVGGSDRHQPGYPDPDPEVLQVGSPTTWLYLEALSVDAVLNAIRRGRAFVSELPAGPRLELRAAGHGLGETINASGKVEIEICVADAEGDVLVLVGSSGFIHQEYVSSSPFTSKVQIATSEIFVRAEVWAGEVRREHHLERIRAAHAQGRLPSNLTPEEVAAHPHRRALSNPIYLNFT